MRASKPFKAMFESFYFMRRCFYYQFAPAILGFLNQRVMRTQLLMGTMQHKYHQQRPYDRVHYYNQF